MRDIEEGEEGGRDFTSTSHTAAESVSSNHGEKHRELGETMSVLLIVKQ